MEKTEISIGALVRLNSGGPSMTVEYVDAYEGVKVSWMTEDDEVRRSTFPVVCVQLT